MCIYRNHANEIHAGCFEREPGSSRIGGSDKWNSAGEFLARVGEFEIITSRFSRFLVYTLKFSVIFTLESSSSLPDIFLSTILKQACKVIRSLVDRACITGMTGYEGGGGSINVQGEEQKKLDVITNDVLSKNLRFTGQVQSSEFDTNLARTWLIVASGCWHFLMCCTGCGDSIRGGGKPIFQRGRIQARGETDFWAKLRKSLTCCEHTERRQRQDTTPPGKSREFVAVNVGKKYVTVL